MSHPPNVEKLSDNWSPFFVNGVYNLLPGFGVLLVVEARGARPLGAHRFNI